MKVKFDDAILTLPSAADLRAMSDSEKLELLSESKDKPRPEICWMIRAGQICDDLLRNRRQLMKFAMAVSMKRGFPVPDEEASARYMLAKVLWPKAAYPHMHRLHGKSKDTKGGMRITSWRRAYQRHRNSAENLRVPTGPQLFRMLLENLPDGPAKQSVLVACRDEYGQDRVNYWMRRGQRRRL